MTSGAWSQAGWSHAGAMARVRWLGIIPTMRESWRYVWEVECAEASPGSLCVSLVRRREHQFARHLMSRTETLERTVLFSRTFRPLLEAVALEHYAAQLRAVARYAQDGRFGCFVESRSNGGNVEVILYDRWFEDGEIRTEELAKRAFDASDAGSLVASTEFLADMRLWADRRNEQREATMLDERDADASRERLKAEREAASAELTQILATQAQPG